MNILITSVGRRTYMVEYFKQAIEGSGELHVSNSELTYAMELADKSTISPLINDEKYIDFLFSYCINNNIEVIIPLFDIDLSILALNKEKFLKKGIYVVVSNFESTRICNDKWLTYQFLKLNGLKTPISYLSIEKCKKDIENKIIQYPLIVKPRWGMGSIGIYEAENIRELKIFYDKTKKTILRSYLKIESKIDFDNSVIIQEKAMGNEYGLDVFNDLEGNFVCCIPKQKLSMRAGETDSAIIIEDKTLYRLGEKLSKSLKHIANLDVDCIKVGDDFYFIDLNCRFGGQYPFSHLAGVNFPKVIIGMLEEKKIEKDLIKARVGVKGVKDINLKRIN